MNKSTSKSRRYVAMCSRQNFDGYYFKAFTLPEKDEDGRLMTNTSDTASWYFLNRLNLSACIDGCLAEEDFKNVTEQLDWAKEMKPEVQA